MNLFAANSTVESELAIFDPIPKTDLTLQTFKVYFRSWERVTFRAFQDCLAIVSFCRVKAKHVYVVCGVGCISNEE